MSRSFDDKYEQYAQDFDPMQHDRRARKRRKPKAHHTPKKTREEIIEEVADTTALEGDFQMTYQPSRYEEGWLMDSLRTFYDQALISDVLAIVKGGKEASVYRCEPHPSLNMEYVAAKVYRPRMFRQLRNDKTYREGREILSTSGKAVRENDLRSMRAIGKGTSFGQQMAHTSWLMHEYVTLQKLHDLGAAVPKPVGSGENAILMGYCGDGYMPAPTLERVALEPGEAEPLFNEVLRNIDLMMQHGMIHGDLSAYNILYWDGDITLIDFPQVTDAHQNPNAFRILSRDVTRVCEYFAGQGVECDAEAIVHELWRTYAATDPEAEAADLSRLLEDPFEE